MGRKPSKNLNLPPRMRARMQKSGRIFYYYDHGGKPRKETPLGSVYVEAIRLWAELECADKPTGLLVTFRQVAERYLRDIVPTKAPRTQKDNLAELAKLYEFFDNPPVSIDLIEPIHVRQYLDWRGATAKTRANRERALLSHIFNKAREWGYTAKPNPCQGVRGHKEHHRDVYVDEAAYRAVWNEADEPLRDALDMAWLTGQRPGDCLKMSDTDIKDGLLWVKQNKTGTKLRIAVTGELEALVRRIHKRKYQHGVVSLRLLVDIDGTPLTSTALRSKFDRARKAAGQTWQFRDLRAKAATETETAHGMAAAQNQLGHATSTMTSDYVRHRAGKVVKPTK